MVLKVSGDKYTNVELSLRVPLGGRFPHGDDSKP
jgi:hypothetical protein